MTLSVLALDYDGTIAQGDRLDPSVLEAIADARTRGVTVLLVTGRILDELRRVGGDLHFVDLVDQGADAAPLEAIVRRIEPSGFTKVSALGVEEQRVNVILDLADAGDEDAVLGDAYHVDVRIVLWEADDVLQVPTSALFRRGPQWTVYKVRDGRARLTPAEIGRQTGRDAEVAGGLSEGTTVVVHPPDPLVDGARVAALSEP